MPPTTHRYSVYCHKGVKRKKKHSHLRNWNRESWLYFLKKWLKTMNWLSKGLTTNWLIFAPLLLAVRKTQIISRLFKQNTLHRSLSSEIHQVVSLWRVYSKESRGHSGWTIRSVSDTNHSLYVYHVLGSSLLKTRSQLPCLCFARTMSNKIQHRGQCFKIHVALSACRGVKVK